MEEEKILKSYLHDTDLRDKLQALGHITRDAGLQDEFQTLSGAIFDIKNLLVTLDIYLIIYRNTINVSYKLINSEIYNSGVIIHG